MAKDKKRNEQNPVNVEFGHEFGDVNSAKIYEIPISNDKRRKNKKEKD